MAIQVSLRNSGRDPPRKAIGSLGPIASPGRSVRPTVKYVDDKTRKTLRGPTLTKLANLHECSCLVYRICLSFYAMKYFILYTFVKHGCFFFYYLHYTWISHPFLFNYFTVKNITIIKFKNHILFFISTTIGKHVQ